MLCAKSVKFLTSYRNKAMTDESKYSSRKFILAAFVVICALALLVAKLIDPSTYMTLTGSTLGLYYTGNVAQKFVPSKE
jgi:cell division protein FtsW (lipid II flippase)